jgi:hypothetical protein
VRVPRRPALAGLALFPALALGCGEAEQVEAAVALVLSAHPVLTAGREELVAQGRQRPWSADLVLGYAQKTTELDAAGANAALRLRVPLFDRKHELDAARARAAWRREEGAVLEAFLADLERLCTRAGELREIETLRRFHRDHLAYRRQQVAEGLAEAASLWADALQVQQAEQRAARARAELETARLAAARRHGGTEWSRLQALLGAIAR